jgi:hypothetical protein
VIRWVSFAWFYQTKRDCHLKHPDISSDVQCARICLKISKAKRLPFNCRTLKLPLTLDPMQCAPHGAAGCHNTLLGRRLPRPCPTPLRRRAVQAAGLSSSVMDGTSTSTTDSLVAGVGGSLPSVPSSLITLQSDRRVYGAPGSSVLTTSLIAKATNKTEEEVIFDRGQSSSRPSRLPGHEYAVVEQLTK